MKNLIKLFGLLLLLASCSKSEEIEEPQMPENPHEVEPLPTNVELAESTVQLNNAQLTFLDAVDEENTTLTFSASLPAEYLPQEGQVLLQMTPTETLPYGFVGRVTKIEQTAQGYMVHTDTPTLTEIFKKLQIEGLSRASAESRTIPTDEDGFYKIEHNFDFANKSLKNRGVQLEGALINGFRPYQRIVIDAETGQEDLLFKFDTKSETNLTVFLSPELEFDQVCDLSNGVLLSLTTGGLPIASFLQPYFTVSGSATMGANIGATLNEYNTFAIEKQGLLPKISRLNEAFNLEFQCDLSSKISADFFAGIGLRVDFRLFGRKDLSVGVGPEIGFNAEGECGLFLIEDNNVSTSDYELLKDNHATLSGKTQLSGYIDATLLNKDDEPWHEALAEFTFAEQTFYLLPSFSNATYESNNGQVSAQATVERDLLFDTQVGIATYRDNQVQQYGKGYSYHFAGNFSENPITEQFKDEDDVEYWTYIKLGGEYVRGVRLSDDLRELLIKFYHDTGGDNWTRNDNWCSDKPIDEWYGVDYGDMDEDGIKECYIQLSINNLTGKADLSGCTALEELYCPCNQLTSLNVSGCTALRRWNCEGNQLTSLDVSECTALTGLACHANQLTSLDVSECTALTGLGCGANQLTSLDVSGCTALTELWCASNQLTSLDVSGCTALEVLYCHENQLTSLDVSGCTALELLCCVDNPITQPITDFYRSLQYLGGFGYDPRYEYGWKDINGEWVKVWYYGYDDHHGWYYPDEPYSGSVYRGY